MTDAKTFALGLLEQAKRTPHKVTPQSHLFYDLGIDSLTVYRILFELERELSISLELEEMDACLIAGRLFEVVCRAEREK